MSQPTTQPLPPGQQLVAEGKWPNIGERLPADSDAPWSLTITGITGDDVTFTVEQLLALPQTKMTIDIHCVTRWSKLGVDFEGVLLSDLLDKFDIQKTKRFISFGSRSERNHSSSLEIEAAVELPTLIALKVDDKPLGIDHGGPIRNIVPKRYFYKSVKWLTQIDLLEEDRLGFWEAESGYHNQADPWKEQRYMAPAIDRRVAIELIKSRDFSNQDLRSIDATKRDLEKLIAVKALLRDADFTDTNLQNADFTAANLSNAHFRRANLRDACFRGADLEGADLTEADLIGADLTDCSLIGASFFQRENGQQLEAIIDSSTTIPESILEPLVPEQREFILSKLSGH